MITKNPAEFDKKKKVLDLALDRSLSEHIMKVGSKYQNVHISALQNQLQTKSNLHITGSQR